jgi:hypothetical protein
MQRFRHEAIISSIIARRKTAYGYYECARARDISRYFLFRALTARTECPFMRSELYCTLAAPRIINFVSIKIYNSRAPVNTTQPRNFVGTRALSLSNFQN